MPCRLQLLVGSKCVCPGAWEPTEGRGEISLLADARNVHNARLSPFLCFLIFTLKEAERLKSWMQGALEILPHRGREAGPQTPVSAKEVGLVEYYSALNGTGTAMCYILMNLGNTMLNKRSQIQKARVYDFISMKWTKPQTQRAAGVWSGAGDRSSGEGQCFLGARGPSGEMRKLWD